jgi:hypothetical protein
MENMSFGQNKMGIGHEGSQGQTLRAEGQKKKKKKKRGRST